MVITMKHSIFFFALTLGMLLTGCDGAGPSEDAAEPRFEMTLGAPVNASLQGIAALGNGASFEEQNLFTFPLPHSGKTVTAIQLFGRDAQDVVHDLSLVYIADEMIATGTYDLSGRFGTCMEKRPDNCPPERLFPDNLLMAHYARQTDDSLYSYLADSGTVAIEYAAEDEVSGAFDLSTAVEISVAKTDLEVFIDSTRTRSGDDFPELPPMHIRALNPPLIITGSFTATPGDFSNQVHHFNWMMSGGTIGR